MLFEAGVLKPEGVEGWTTVMSVLPALFSEVKMADALACPSPKEIGSDDVIDPMVASEFVKFTLTVPEPAAMGWKANGFRPESSCMGKTVTSVCRLTPVEKLAVRMDELAEIANPDGVRVALPVQDPNAPALTEIFAEPRAPLPTPTR